jgi:sortase A
MTSRNSRSAVRWLERLLFLVGGVLALWCLVVVLRAEYYARMPVPDPPPLAARLPGEADGDTSARHSARPPGSWVARLEGPSVELAATVLEGSDEATLSRAAGHIEDTAFPGERGNIGIAGHRDTVFRPLRRIQVGDSLKLTTADRVFQYRISETKVVSPEDVGVLDSTDHPAITLVTCYPFEFIGHAPRRFIVRADLVTEEARTPQAGGASGTGVAGGTGGAGRPGEAAPPAPPGLVSGDHHREKSAVVRDRVVVDGKHQRAVRRHPDRLHAGSKRQGHAVAHPADEPADRQRAHRPGAALQRIVGAGARGLRRVFTKD